jgi:peptidoglycan/LPS O-acetylase OafA/YrhL
MVDRFSTYADTGIAMKEQNALHGVGRFQGLDSLRGIAALAVVLHHYTFRYPSVVQAHQPGLLFNFVNGHFGVNLFFIISGFVIFMTLERSAGMVDFSVSRFARLWPPYLVCAAFTGSLIWLLHFNPEHLRLKDALLNPLMMNKLLGNIPIDGSYWTLTYEVLFYAGAAIVFFNLRIRRIEWACLAWLALAFVARVSGFNANHLRSGVFLGVDFCHLFILGMMIYLISQRRNTWLTMVTAALAFLMTLFGPYYDPAGIKLWQFMLMTACFAVAVWLAAERRLRLLNVWPLLFLGEISYSLYLVHQVAGYWVINKLESRGWNPNIVVLLTILAAIGVATCVRKLVEIPAQKAIRNWYRDSGRYYFPSPHRGVHSGGFRSVSKVPSL